MKAILVSVDYSDILRLTLPYNRHHFDQVMVVTSRDDFPNVKPICDANEAICYVTNAFYDNGADFNKWKALEEALDHYGRDGWLCIMDADVCWPKDLLVHDGYKKDDPSQIWLNLVRGYELNCIGSQVFPGYLCTPMRRMHIDIPQEIPQESDWVKYPLHPQQREWAGYTQIFHASDPHLGPAPWHQTNWKHAGGADSFFQAKWPQEYKVRPPFEVLHLGPAGVNWCGRSSPYADGSQRPDAQQRAAKIRQYIVGRRIIPRAEDRFKGEKS